MRRHAWMAAAVAFFASSAKAAEEGPAPSFAVRAGAAASTYSASPSFELGAAYPFGRRLALDAEVGAWTLINQTTGSATELAATIGPSFQGALTDSLSWKVAAGPAFMYSNGALTTYAFHGGVAVSPSLSLATRRRTLSLDLGARSYVFSDTVRFGVVAGASYSFR